MNRDNLLRWAMYVCGEIQKHKTYANRFPETANLGAEIADYFEQLRNAGKCTCQSFENGLVADDCKLHG